MAVRRRRSTRHAHHTAKTHKGHHHAATHATHGHHKPAKAHPTHKPSVHAHKTTKAAHKALKSVTHPDLVKHTPPHAKVDVVHYATSHLGLTKFHRQVRPTRTKR